VLRAIHGGRLAATDPLHLSAEFFDEVHDTLLRP
jgi:hypothetical protein